MTAWPCGCSRARSAEGDTVTLDWSTAASSSAEPGHQVGGIARHVGRVHGDEPGCRRLADQCERVASAQVLLGDPDTCAGVQRKYSDARSRFIGCTSLSIRRHLRSEYRRK